MENLHKLGISITRVSIPGYIQNTREDRCEVIAIMRYIYYEGKTLQKQGYPNDKQIKGIPMELPKWGAYWI